MGKYELMEPCVMRVVTKLVYYINFKVMVLLMLSPVYTEEFQ